MTKDEFLSLVNDIDDEFLNELADSELRDKDSEFPPEEFGAPQKPLVVRLERPPRRRAPLRTAAFVSVAAAAICAVTAGVFVKLNKPQTVSPNSGVTLSGTSSESEPIITEPKIDRVERDGYDFSLKIIEGEMVSFFSEPFVKTDSEKQIAISIETCRGASEEYPLTIWFLVQEDGIIKKRIGDLIITDKSVKKYTVPYSVQELEQGEECVMKIFSENNVLLRGKILP